MAIDDCTIRPAADDDGQEALARGLADDPIACFGSALAMHRIEREELEALQLRALRQRFALLRDKVAALTVMAEQQGVTDIAALDDAVPLLFPDTVYKSYPRSFLDNGRFNQLARWMGRLSTSGVGAVDFSDCDSIDSWMDALDARTDLLVAHSSGTTGTVSFMPRSRAEWQSSFRQRHAGMMASLYGDDAGHHDEVFRTVWPGFRRGGSAILRSVDFLRDFYSGGREENLYVLYPHRMSSDVSLLAARLRSATARGEAVALDERMQARRGEFEALQRDTQDRMPAFLDQVARDLAGQRINIGGTWNILWEMAREGLVRGLSGLFAPDSLVWTGGGAKGQTVPDGWMDDVRRYTGAKRIVMAYGMSEVMAIHRACDHGRYHVEPTAILFLLDPETGAPLPRTGRQVGRAAFLDLKARTYWGGIITGDEIEVDWTPCACGLATAHIGPTISRYSERNGGDDKISCAAAGEAHAQALDFLTSSLG